MRGVDVQCIQEVDKQRVGERSQCAYIFVTVTGRLAQATARAVEQQAAEVQLRHEWRPARSPVRAAVNEHNGRTLADLLDAHIGVNAGKMHAAFDRRQAKRSPQALLGFAETTFIHRQGSRLQSACVFRARRASNGASAAKRTRAVTRLKSPAHFCSMTPQAERAPASPVASVVASGSGS